MKPAACRAAPGSNRAARRLQNPPSLSTRHDIGRFDAGPPPTPRDQPGPGLERAAARPVSPPSAPTPLQARIADARPLPPVFRRVPCRAVDDRHSAEDTDCGFPMLYATTPTPFGSGPPHSRRRPTQGSALQSPTAHPTAQTVNHARETDLNSPYAGMPGRTFASSRSINSGLSLPRGAVPSPADAPQMRIGACVATAVQGPPQRGLGLGCSLPVPQSHPTPHHSALRGKPFGLLVTVLLGVPQRRSL
jgi:hypothetical protein